MGKYLRATDRLPDRILSSDARRALETAHRFAEAAGIAAERIVVVPELYDSDPDTIREVISRHGQDAGTVMVVAHNPGISELAYRLSGEAACEWMPTAAAAILTLDEECEGKIDRSCIEEVECITPTELGVRKKKKGK